MTYIKDNENSTRDSKSPDKIVGDEGLWVNQISRVAHFSRILRMADIYVTFFTAIHLVIAILNITDVFNIRGEIIILIEVLLVTVIVAMAITFEYYRKKGDVYFEEISDELQWNVAKKYAQSNLRDESLDNSSNARPPIDIRIVLREYSHATSMFLISSRMAPFFFIVLNVTILIISAVFLGAIIPRL